ncbi:MAG: hypothetical protein FWC10_00255 [Lentimicrobiaceae bacterium]|nr:hypothetical protein [Lentimicrobiaceae bacterium]
MVKSNAPETFLAETAFSMKYNTSIFDSLPHNKISYTMEFIPTQRAENYELRITNYELGMGAPSVVEVEVFDVYGRKLTSHQHLSPSFRSLFCENSH